jgi:hypothetical protein
MEFEYVKHYYRNFSYNFYTYTGGTKAVNVTQKTTNVRDYERNSLHFFNTKTASE